MIIGVDKMKKIISILLAFIMLLGTVGCSKNEPLDTDVNENTTESTTNEESTTETTTFFENDTTQTTKKDSQTTTTTQKNETTTQKDETTTKKSENPTKPSEEKVTVKKVEMNHSSGKQVVYYLSDISKQGVSYPALVWANGTGFTYTIYEKLLIEIAKGGYIVIATEETMSADGKAQRESIDFIIEQNDDENSIFYKKVKTDKIGAMGHSQGGRSTVNAAAADSRIDCAISVAGSNFVEEAQALSTPTFFIAGSSDMIVDAKMWIVPAYENCKGPAVYASRKGAIHTRCCTNPTEYSVYMLDWFDYYLKGDSDAINTFKDGGTLSKDSNWINFACKGL